MIGSLRDSKTWSWRAAASQGQLIALWLLAIAAITAIVAPNDARGSARTPQEQASGRGVLAQLFYRQLPDSDRFRDMRLRIVRRGATALDARVQPHPESPGQDRLFPGRGGRKYGRSIHVRDLDGDREPEVLLELFWGGTHCCWWWRVYRFDRSPGTYRFTMHMWGDAATRPSLRDVNGDRALEFVSRDERFVGAFTGYAASYPPLQIWRFEDGRFVDVTRALRRQLIADATLIERQMPAFAPEARGAGAAWAAEQALLGRAADARRQMIAWARRGFFDGYRNAGTEFAPVGTKYVEAVWRLLRELGYLP